VSRSFAAARRAARREPVTFDLTFEVAEQLPDDTEGAQPGATREVVREVTEHFSCRGQVSTLTLSELARQADLDLSNPMAVALVAEFFVAAFDDAEQYKRFRRVIGDHFDDEVLMEVLAGLVEDFLSRPTKAPSPSPGTPSTTGSTSRDASSLPAAGQLLRIPTPDEIAAYQAAVARGEITPAVSSA